ncbi:MAG: nucleoside hydrolase [Candidatus Limnocylindrales bacterium]
MPTKLILDVDTGTDDAVALMLAALHPELELVGATTVNGNVGVESCTENSLRVFDYIGVPIPVYEGVAHPIARADFPIARPDIQSTSAVHGQYLDIPASTTKKQSTSAVEFLVETYRSATDEIILVPVGPLSNIATALTVEPRLKDRIPELIIMGGANRYGNVTPRAEFNIWADPEAARVVLNSGVRKITPGATRRHPQGARLARRLRPIAGARYARRGGRRPIHGAPDPGLRHDPADGASARGARPRRAGRRRDRGSNGDRDALPARRRRDTRRTHRGRDGRRYEPAQRARPERPHRPRRG